MPYMSLPPRAPDLRARHATGTHCKFDHSLIGQMGSRLGHRPLFWFQRSPSNPALREGWGCRWASTASFSLGQSHIGPSQRNRWDAYSACALTCRHGEDRREGKPRSGRRQSSDCRKCNKEHFLWRVWCEAPSRWGARKKGLRRAMRVISMAGGSLSRSWGQWGFEDGRPCLWWREGHSVVTRDRMALTHHLRSSVTTQRWGWDLFGRSHKSQRLPSYGACPTFLAGWTWGYRVIECEGKRISGGPVCSRVTLSSFVVLDAPSALLNPFSGIWLSTSPCLCWDPPQAEAVLNCGQMGQGDRHPASLTLGWGDSEVCSVQRWLWLPQ